MKRFLITIILIISCCLFVSCGDTAAISGEPEIYTNIDQSFSIEVPTRSDSDWNINNDTTTDVLDMSYSDDTLGIIVQSVSKSEVLPVAPSLEGYREYAMANLLGSFSPDMELKDSEVSLPGFIVNSIPQSFTIKKGGNTVQGTVVFMESSQGYYTYLVMGVSKVYKANENALLETIMTLKETNGK